MSHYQHLSIEEGEKILILYTENQSLRFIAKIIGRSVSTVSRELKRNSNSQRSYSAIEAHRNYLKRRKKCRRHKLLANEDLKCRIKRLFLECQWLTEEISNRLAYEKSNYKISYTTIYRAIYAGLFDEPNLSHGNRGAIRKLRYRGKTRHQNGTIERRGKIVISNRIQDRPKEANERQKIGHWGQILWLEKPAQLAL